MIDYLSAFSRKVVWLKPLFFCTTIAAIILFAYLVLSGNSADTEVYIIPSIVGLLWSLVCLILLFAFPHVPPQPESQQRFYSRLKTRLARGCYYIFALLFIVLSTSAVLLTFKLLNVWRTDF